MKKNSKIYVAGHKGLAGSAIMRELQKNGYNNLVLRTRAQLDLLDQKAVEKFFAKEKPEYVFLAAAKVGGIGANINYPADFIYENLEIQTNVIHSSFKSNVKKLLFLGSSCIYPKGVKQPMKEEYLLTGIPEPSNRAYSLAKIAGIVLCQSYNKQYGTNFISVMPTNLYGPNDKFDINTSHVIPTLLIKFHQAKITGKKEVIAWGTGKPKREFLYSDDLASACYFLMKNYNQSEIINIGTGKDISIKDLAELIKEIVGFEGKIIWDTSKPDGVRRKLLDVSKIRKLGWRHKTELKEGLKKSYEWYVENIASK